MSAVAPITDSVSYKSLIKSLIDFDGTLTPEQLTWNLEQALRAKLTFHRNDDRSIMAFVEQYHAAYFECPSRAIVEDHLTRAEDLEAVERLNDIANPGVKAYARTGVRHLVDQATEERVRVTGSAALKEAHDITTKGIPITTGPDRGKMLKGFREAVILLNEKAAAILDDGTHGRTSGDLRDEGPAVIAEYDESKANAGKSLGKFCGIASIDASCRGGKPGELWIHGAYPGELKTSFSLNWAYNLVTRYRTNVVYFSLEMPFEQIRRQVYTLHSTSLRWREEGRKTMGLDYGLVRDGALPAEDETFFKRVADDFTSNPDYATFHVETPDRGVTIDDIKARCEALHRQMEVGFVVIDHGGLVEPRKSDRRSDYVVELNSIVRGAKNLALHFDHGNKVPVLLLWQINREGKEEADKADGRYKLKAFTYANEVEKSADVITTTYLNDDHRANGTTLFCNLKNRDNPRFAPFTAGVHFPSRLIAERDRFESKGMGIDTEDFHALV